MLVSAVQQNESSISTQKFIPSWASLPPSPSLPSRFLPYFYLLPLTTNNPCLGYIEFLNISPGHQVLLQLQSSFFFWLLFGGKIVLWLCKRNTCLGSCVLGGSCSDPLLHREGSLWVICLPRRHTSPSRSHSWCPGLASCLSKGPKPVSRATVDLFPCASSRGQPIPSAWPLLMGGQPWGTAWRRARVRPKCAHKAREDLVTG